MKRLKKLRLTRVDLVPAGANPGAHIRLFKAAKEAEDGPRDPAGDSANVRNPVKTSPAGVVSNSVKSANPPEVPTMTEPVTAGAPDVQAELDAVKKQLADTEAQLAAAATPDESDVRKDLDATRAELDTLRKAQRASEFVEKARKFSTLGDAEQIGRLLEAADSHFGEDEQKAFSQILKSAAEQVEKGSLFKRLSQDADEPQTWEAKLQEAARDRVAKGDAPTVEQAKVQIMREDKELRREYADSRKVK